jgi:glycosyltransferase involved in cell wall biosynthesis
MARPVGGCLLLVVCLDKRDADMTTMRESANRSRNGESAYVARPAKGTASAALRVMHVITDLDVGGAESMLVSIATNRFTPDLEQNVVSLLSDGVQLSRLRAGGIPTTELGLTRAWPNPLEILRFARLIRAVRPDVIQGWLYHGDIAALAALTLSGRRRKTVLAWGLRGSNIDFSLYSLKLRMVAAAWPLLSRLPDVVIANSYKGLDAHRTFGYAPPRAEVIHNGVDIERFKPDPAAHVDVRRQLGIGEDEVLVAHVARKDPMKDHATFVAAMGKLPHVRALAIGAGTELLRTPPNVLCLGLRDDVPRLLTAANVIVSSSAFGEGFSNAITEGMATALTPVSTDVGDARIIVDDVGIVVPPRDADALAEGIRRIVEAPAAERNERGARARARVVENFSLERAARRFADLYHELVTLRRR